MMTTIQTTEGEIIIDCGGIGGRAALFNAKKCIFARDINYFYGRAHCRYLYPYNNDRFEYNITRSVNTFPPERYFYAFACVL